MAVGTSIQARVGCTFTPAFTILKIYFFKIHVVVEIVLLIATVGMFYKIKLYIDGDEI